MAATPGRRPDSDARPDTVSGSASLSDAYSPATSAVRRQRVYACGLALLGWLALALQFYVTLSARIAMGTGALGVAGGVIHLLSYFTILTNLLVAVTSTLQAMAPATRAARWLAQPAVATGTATSIVFVGIAYSLLLRHLSHAQGLELLANHLLHDVIPPLFLIYWWWCIERRPSTLPTLQHLLRWSLYPIVYFVYVLARGAMFGLYPYPFIDVGQLGYAHAVVNALGILVGFWAIGALLIAGSRYRGGSQAATEA